MPPRPDVDASYAVPIRRAGTLPAASFRSRVAPDTLAVRLTVPVTRVRRGLSPRKSQGGHPQVDTRPPQSGEWRSRAVRHAWRTKKGWPEALLRAGRRFKRDRNGLNRQGHRQSWRPTNAVMKSALLQTTAQLAPGLKAHRLARLAEPPQVCAVHGIQRRRRRWRRATCRIDERHPSCLA